MKNKNNKSGFTLVELAIVLVIIGLLIGGILVAQSMINTTKIQSQVRQFGQFDAAVSTFVSKYDNLPGDTTLMGATPGNGNGYIADASNYVNTEVGHFWYDLGVAGLNNPKNNGTYTDASGGAAMSTSVFPAPVLSATGYVIPYGSTATTPAAGNWYTLSAPTTGGAAAAVVPLIAIKGADALAVDKKMDDGIGNTGNVIGNGSAANTVVKATQVPTANTCDDSSTGVYVTSGTVPICILAVRIGSSTGDLK